LIQILDRHGCPSSLRQQSSAKNRDFRFHSIGLMR